MKYTILGFQQTKLIDNDLDVTDALILRTMKDMYSTAGMEFIIKDKKQYMWVNYTYFLKQIPIIGSRSSLMRRIKVYEEKGLLLRETRYEKDGKKGTFAYVAPTVDLDKLQDYDPISNSDKGCLNSGQGVSQNDTEGVSILDNKDTSIKDTSIKDTSIKEVVEDTSDNNLKEFKIDEDMKRVARSFEQNGLGFINITIKERLELLLKEYPVEWITKSFERAVIRNRRNLGYAEGILSSWKNKGGMDLGGNNSGKSSRDNRGRESGGPSKEADEFYKKAKERGWDDIKPEDLECDF